MPNTSSAAKRLRQNVVQRDRNRSIKSALRGQVRKVRELIAAGDVGKAEEGYRVVAKKLDQAGALNLIHRNAAARTKSRLQSAIKKAKQTA